MPGILEELAANAAGAQAWDAFLFAWEAHRGQKYKWHDEDYINHSVRVAQRLRVPIQVVGALLHDTVEDTAATLDDIERRFGETVREIVDALTRRENEPYLTAYLNRVRANYNATQIKLADLQENLSKLDDPHVPYGIAESLRERYTRAIVFLQEGRHF